MERYAFLFVFKHNTTKLEFDYKTPKPAYKI